MPHGDEPLASHSEAETEASETRQRIIQAAIKVFSEEGFVKATTRKIAAVADVNEVTLFRHFGNKKNLLAAVIQRHTDLSGLQRVLEEELTGDYRQDLQRLGMYLVTEMTREQDTMRLIMWESVHVPELKAVITQMPHQMRQMLMGYFRRQIEVGIVRPELEPEAIAQAFMGMFLVYGSKARRFLAENSGISIDVMVAQFVDILERGTASANFSDL